MGKFVSSAVAAAYLSAISHPCLAEQVFIMPSAEKCAALPNVNSWPCLAGVIKALEVTLKKYYEATHSSIQKRAADEEDIAAQDLNEAVNSLEHAQSSWKAYRDAHCGMIAELYTTGSGKAAGENVCTIDLTRHRIHELWEVSGFPGLPEPK